MVMEQSVPWAGERPARAQAVLTTGLTKRFGDRVVVDDVALAIPSGSVCGFAGPNGAGKANAGHRHFFVTSQPPLTGRPAGRTRDS